MKLATYGFLGVGGTAGVCEIKRGGAVINISTLGAIDCWLRSVKEATPLRCMYSRGVR